MATIQPMCQAVHAKPAMIALEDESGQNEPMQNWRERIRLTPPKILQSPRAPGHALAYARNSAVLRISSKNHSGKGRKSDKLPKDIETLVQAEFLIASHHRDLFRQSLGDDLTVERVRVQER